MYKQEQKKEKNILLYFDYNRLKSRVLLSCLEMKRNGCKRCESSANVLKLKSFVFFLDSKMTTTTIRPVDDQVRIIILNEGEDKSEELYRLKKGL